MATSEQWLPSHEGLPVAQSDWVVLDLNHNPLPGFPHKSHNNSVLFSDSLFKVGLPSLTWRTRDRLKRSIVA